MLLWWVGLSFFLAPSLAVFNGAFVFNQDVSKWNTGAVRTMYGSKCNPSPFVGMPSFVGFLNTTTRVSSDHNFLRVLLYFVLCFGRYLFVLVVLWLWWVGLSFFVAPCHPVLQCLLPHVHSTRTCPNGRRGRW